MYLDRRGEEFVEAAIVLPMLILTILSMIMIAVFLYRYQVKQSDAHISLMREASASGSMFSVMRKDASYSDHVRGAYASAFQKGGTFRAYAIRQADAVRIGSLAGSGGEDAG